MVDQENTLLYMGSGHHNGAEIDLICFFPRLPAAMALNIKNLMDETSQFAAFTQQETHYFLIPSTLTPQTLFSA